MTALGRQGNLFRRRITVDSAAEAPLNIDDQDIKSGYMAGITRISIENETSDYTRLRIGVFSNGTFHPCEEEQNPNADTLYWISEEIFLGEGERIRAELTGTVAADRINVYIEGYIARIIS